MLQGIHHLQQWLEMVSQYSFEWNFICNTLVSDGDKQGVEDHQPTTNSDNGESLNKDQQGIVIVYKLRRNLFFNSLIHEWVATLLL